MLGAVIGLLFFYTVLAGGYVVFAWIHFDDTKPSGLAWTDTDKHKQAVLMAAWERRRAKFVLLAPAWPIVVAGVLANWVAKLFHTLRAPLPEAKTAEQIEAEKEVELELGDGK